MPLRPEPFENRWSSGERGRQWLLRLDNEGLANVRACFAEQQARAGDGTEPFDDVPAGFIRDWLAWRDRCDALATRNRHRVVVVLLVTAIILLAIILWRTTRRA